jgi:hypothetical protein
MQSGTYLDPHCTDRDTYRVQAIFLLRVERYTILNMGSKVLSTHSLLLDDWYD